VSRRLTAPNPPEYLLNARNSRLLPRHLPPQPLPRLHFAQIRPFPRPRHGHGGRRTRRPIILPTHKERPRVQAFCAPTAGVQILACGDKGGLAGIRVQLERDLQPAGVLARVSGILVDLGLLDHEEANTEHDQVQVGTFFGDTCWMKCVLMGYTGMCRGTLAKRSMPAERNRFLEVALYSMSPDCIRGVWVGITSIQQSS